MATSCVAKIKDNVSTVPVMPVPCVRADLGRGGPPPRHRQAGGFCGRPFCRIYPEGDGWILEAVRSGWGTLGIPNRKLSFPTLTAAISYAVTHGFSYRVVHAHRQTVQVGESPGASGCTNKKFQDGY